jgi:predicted Ser/Thr protein kinase
MAASFKIPTSLKRKAKKDPELPKFEWKRFEKENKLGCGTFGCVYLAKYKGKPEKVVAKKNNVESIDSKSCFEKEAALLNIQKATGT